LNTGSVEIFEPGPFRQIANDIYRVSTPVRLEDAGGFFFNQYLIVDDDPLLGRQPSHACTVALGMVTGQSFCVRWPMS
jgi:hypothetical protein